MNILATGGSGLIGSGVVEQLSQAGHTLSDASLETGIDLLTNEGFNSFFTEDAPDLIIHIAAFNDTKAAQEQADDYTGLCYRLNTELTRSIAEYALHHSAHLIYISTDYVFDGEQHQKYTEKDQPEPETWYGKTKYLGEREVIASGVDYTIVRVAYPFGNTTALTSDFVVSIAQKMQDGTLYPMFSDQMITPTYLPDIARAIVAIASDLEKARNHVFHVVGDETISPFELAERIQAQLSLFEPITKGSLHSAIKNRGEQIVVYPISLSLDNTLFKKVFGFAFTPLDQALAEVL